MCALLDNGSAIDIHLKVVILSRALAQRESDAVEVSFSYHVASSTLCHRASRTYNNIIQLS